MDHSALTLFVPFSPCGESWVVRRAHTVVETLPNREDAVMAAFRLASELSGRMGADVRIEVQESDGGWHALSPVHAHKSARRFAKLHKSDEEKGPGNQKRA